MSFLHDFNGLAKKRQQQKGNAEAKKICRCPAFAPAIISIAPRPNPLSSKSTQKLLLTSGEEWYKVGICGENTAIKNLGNLYKYPEKHRHAPRQTPPLS